MTLATVDPEGRPSARMVICRGIDARAGWIVFYTDRESAKGKALDVNPYAALVFNWDAHERQARIEGPVTLAPEADADAYLKSRPPDARATAAASDQTRPIASRAAFLAKIEEAKPPIPFFILLAPLSAFPATRQLDFICQCAGTKRT